MADAERTGPRRLGYLLVAVPDWPSQDPGRRMIYRVYPTERKAQSKAKRFGRRYPEFIWTGVGMTEAEARALERKPFVLRELGVEVQPTASGARVVRL